MVLNRREYAHSLLNTVSDEKLDEVNSMLETLVSPHERYLASIPIEDEELTPEAIARLEAARLDPSPPIPHEEILKEFGLEP